MLVAGNLIKSISASPKLANRQGAQLSKLTRWYDPAEILKMATSTNAELLALSGLRSPYEGRLGVVQQGALADGTIHKNKVT